MKQTFRAFLLLLLLVMGTTMSWADFKNFTAVLNNQDGTLLTAEEQVQGTAVSFGVAVDDAGNVSRVESTDETAVATISGKYHSDHGMTNLVVTVPVDGSVKISIGQCTYSGGTIAVKDANGTTVAEKTPGQACWKNDRSNVTEIYYTGDATTLTISGMGYCPFVGVEKNENVIARYDVTYALGDETAEGVVPAAVTWTEGDTYTIPANYTLYKEGYTLKGWTDGTVTVKAGDVYAPTADVTLTPVFTQNVKNLAGRTAPVTLKWNFRRDQGAPVIAVQGSGNGVGVWVTQAEVDGEIIDVKLDYDATAGKINNANNTDWAQMNNGTKFILPSAKGAVVSMEAYSTISSTTIDGQSDYTSANTINYTIANSAETIDVVIGDGSYYRYIQTVLPVVSQEESGKTYTDEAASIVWALDGNTDVTSTLPADGFATKAFELGSATISGTGTGQATYPDGSAVTLLKIKPAKGASDTFAANMKAAAGLTFTPTKISCYIGRFGTDAANGVTVTATANGETITLGNYTAPRNNQAQDKDKFGTNDNYTNQVVIELTPEQQAKLATGDMFTVAFTIGVNSGKEGGFGQLTVDGVLNGTIASVNKYTLELAATPEDGGEVSVYPKSEEYIENDEVTLTATENFGYDFVNWTNAAGEEVSTEAKFKYTVTGNETLTANFKKVNTYVLDITVEGGANDYMVSLSPEPTVVDGKNMYEEGTKVTMTAASNPILTFTNWSNGETASEMAINMTGDKAFTASYSAVDYIVGWDFMKAGGAGRPGDFAAADNDAVSLVMRNDAGDESGWLDKSQFNAGGYEGRPAAVNWRTGSSNGDIGYYYWQTCVNAAAFTDIKVITAMLYNYNAYTTQLVEYSLDGETWSTVGKIVISGNKNWTDATIALPADANNQEKVYIRWISDKTSQIAGTASANDGIALGATYIVGTAKLIDDGTAPVLVSSVPADKSEGASANGKVVLTFDEKIKLTENAKATLDGVALKPVVSGKTVICEYKGLNYSTDAQFVLAGGSVADLTDNAIAEDIVINFQTKVKPSVDKALYDFIVPVDGTITEALAAANARGANATERYRILITNGNYVFDCHGTTVGGDGKEYDDPRSHLTSPYVSFIGESMEGVTITNKTPEATWNNGFGTACPLEGIGNGDVLIIQKDGHDAYFQNLTLKSSMGDNHGRDIVLQDKSNRTIFKDACLWGYQDTYVSNSEAGKYYFEGGVLRGCTDFLCGKGDVFYNEVTLQQCGTGGYLAVPSKAKKYGYVFLNCYIKKETSDVSFYLGRPWGTGTPIACFINTKMDGNALGNGWADMSGGWPARFAEYNSFLTSGTSIDLSTRRTSFNGSDGNVHANDPILTIDDVNAMSLANVMGQDDDWDPTALTEQASAPANVMLDSDTNVLTWDDNSYVLCWVISKDGKFVTATTSNSYEVDDATAKWTVRAANEMGGLGEASEAKVITPVDVTQFVGEYLVDATVTGGGTTAEFKGQTIKVESGAKAGTVNITLPAATYNTHSMSATVINGVKLIEMGDGKYGMAGEGFKVTVDDTEFTANMNAKDNYFEVTDGRVTALTTNIQATSAKGDITVIYQLAGFDAIISVGTVDVVAPAKRIENGRIVIEKNGVLYGVDGIRK